MCKGSPNIVEYRKIDPLKIPRSAMRFEPVFKLIQPKQRLLYMHMIKIDV